MAFPVEIPLGHPSHQYLSIYIYVFEFAYQSGNASMACLSLAVHAPWTFPGGFLVF